MACPNHQSPTFHPFVQFCLARVTSYPPRLTHWYAGPTVGWVTDPRRACMFASRGAAVVLREVLGSSVVIQVYSMPGGELVDEF